MEKQQQIIKQQNKFEAAAGNYISEANEVFRELVRQLILVATVFLTISSFVFGLNDNLLQKINIYLKFTLVFSWGLFVFSIIFGIVQFFIDNNFFIKWAKAKSAVVDYICSNKNSANCLGEVAYQTQKDLPRESLTVFVYLQTFFLLLGVILLIVVSTIVLFNI